MVLYIGYLLICMVFIEYLWIFMVLYMNIYCRFYKYRYLFLLGALAGHKKKRPGRLK